MINISKKYFIDRVYDSINNYDRYDSFCLNVLYDSGCFQKTNWDESSKMDDHIVDIIRRRGNKI